jgi:hypothetical protein
VSSAISGRSASRRTSASSSGDALIQVIDGAAGASGGPGRSAGGVVEMGGGPLRRALDDGLLPALEAPPQRLEAFVVRDHVDR